MRSLWAYIVSNPAVFKRINGWLTVFWTAMVPVSILLGWIHSVAFISALSIYALITGHMATWQATRVEVRQEAQEEARDEGFEDKVKQDLAEIKKCIAGSSNGRTAGFDPVNAGSTPAPATMGLARHTRPVGDVQQSDICPYGDTG